jgi:alpha-beta hydrolase superfamily lysophospholipase
MTLKKTLGIALALILIAISWLGLTNLRTNLVVRSISQQDVPMLFMAPQGVQHRPGVLIAHGFAGSKQLMLGYGYTLAHNGYGVLLLDFAGHGANAAPLDKIKLRQNLDVALSVLRAQPEIDPAKIGLMGHSMGSRAVMLAGIEQPNAISAVVAISPTSLLKSHRTNPLTFSFRQVNGKDDSSNNLQSCYSRREEKTQIPMKGKGDLASLCPRLNTFSSCLRI